MGRGGCALKHVARCALKYLAGGRGSFAFGGERAVSAGWIFLCKELLYGIVGLGFCLMWGGVMLEI